MPVECSGRLRRVPRGDATPPRAAGQVRRPAEHVDLPLGRDDGLGHPLLPVPPECRGSLRWRGSRSPAVARYAASAVDTPDGRSYAWGTRAEQARARALRWSRTCLSCRGRGSPSCREPRDRCEAIIASQARRWKQVGTFVELHQNAEAPATSPARSSRSSTSTWARALPSHTSSTA